MEKAKFERIQDNASFTVDLLSFHTTAVTSYDPLIANQTILSAWDTSVLEAYKPPISNR